MQSNRARFKEQKVATISDTAHTKVDLTVSGEAVETQDGISIIPHYYSLRKWSLSGRHGKRGGNRSTVTEFRIPFETAEELAKVLQQDSNQRQQSLSRSPNPSYSSFSGSRASRSAA